MGLKVTNNAFGTLNAGINSTDTVIVLEAGQGARFPVLGAGDYFYATLIDTSNQLEIVKVTARATDTMTVVRAQDGTTARAYNVNDRFELRPTAALFNEKANADDVTASLATKVNKAGDTMTGALNIVTDTGSTTGIVTALVVDAEAPGALQAGAGTAIELRGKSAGGNIANHTHIRLRSVANIDNNAHGFALDYRPSLASPLTEGIRCDSNGRVTMPNQPGFKVWLTGFSKNASWQKITGFSTAVFNAGGHFNTSTSRFTAPVSGYYQFSVGGWATANSAGTRYATSFSINGGGQFFLAGGCYCSTDSPMNEHSELFFLNANDSVDLFGFSAITTTWGGGHSFWWSGRLVG